MKAKKVDIIVFLLSSFAIIFLYIYFNYNKSLMFFFTNFLIIVVSAAAISFSNYNFSIFKLFFIFVFLAFGIIPMIERSKCIYYWNGSPIDESSFIMTNLIILIDLLFFIIGYTFATKTSKFNYYKEFCSYQKINYSVRKRKTFFIFIISIIYISIAFYTLSFFNFDFLLIWFRNIPGISKPIHSQIESLIFYYFLRPTLVTVFLLYFSFFAFKESKVMLLFVISIIIFFLPPTSIARFSAIALYLSLILYMTNIFSNKHYMFYYSIFGLLVVLPFLDKFRYFNIEKFDFTINYSFLTQGHFDSYQNFVRVVDSDIVTYGYQLLGPLLFWFPRNLWPDKPIGSGNLLSHISGLSWDNISFPFFAEGYINFWIFGTMTFLFIFGYFSGKLDYKFWHLKKYFQRHYFYGFYLLLMGHTIFLLRGDLLSSFAYTTAVVFSYILFLFIFILFSKIKL